MNTQQKRKKSEPIAYCVYVYGVTGPDHAEQILSRVGRYGVNPIPSFYEPEIKRFGFKFVPSDFHNAEYALVMNFMRGIIPAYRTYMCYTGRGRAIIAKEYDREVNGRRFSHSGNEKQYIDPEPQPAEALQAA